MITRRPPSTWTSSRRSLAASLLLSAVAILAVGMPSPTVAGELVERLAEPRPGREAPAIDPVDQALRLVTGEIVVDGNPLRRVDRSAALDRLAALVAGPDVALARRAARARALIVIADENATPADRGAAAEVLRPIAETDPPAALALALAAEGGALPDDAAPVDVDRLLGIALAAGEAEAAFALARSATVDPSLRDGYLAEGVFRLRLAAGRSSEAQLRLADRLALGDGVAAAPAEAADLYLAALRAGRLRALDGLRASMTPAEGSEDLRPAIRTAMAEAVVAAGSAAAAREIALDVVFSGALGFDAADGVAALDLLAGAADVSGRALAAFTLAKGIGRPADPSAAAAIVATTLAEQPAAAELVAAAHLVGRLEDPAASEIEVALLKGALAAGDAHAGYLAGKRLIERHVRDATFPLEEGLAALREAGRLGSARALTELGDIYGDGILVPRSDETAVDWYRKAVAVNPQPAAQLRLARFLINDVGSAAAIQEAVDLLDRLAVQGDARAAVLLGQLYLGGRDTFVADEAVGLAWLQKAIDAGDGEAMLITGEYMLRANVANTAKASDYLSMARDLGLPAASTALGRLRFRVGDVEAARRLFEEAADAGDPDGMVELGRMMLAGSDVPETLAAAEALFQRAEAAAGDRSTTLTAIADLYAASSSPALKDRGIAILTRLADDGERRAYGKLAIAYSRRGATPENADAAVRWAYKAGEAGTTSALVTVGRALVDGVRLPADPERGIDLLELALQRNPNSVQLLMTLGTVYQRPKTPQTDPVRGFDYLRRAADLGSVAAMILLANAYADGAGTARDPWESYRWFRRAADSGSASARVQLARILFSGVTVAIDPEGAVAQLHKAAESGSTAALLDLGRAMLLGFGVSRDEAGGVARIEQAAELGNAEARYDLYQYYWYRDGPGDAEKAVAWLEGAAAAGNVQAMFRLALIYNIQPEVGGSPERIVYWLKKASSSGVRQPKRALEQYLASGRIDPALAAEIDPDGPPPEIGG